jgi:Pectate lyase superfamily protein
MLNPKDFGAVFNGVKDDAPAWIACIKQARGRTGQASIYFPAGASVINQTLDVSGIGIIGEGSIASKLIAGAGFRGSSILLLSDATEGGAGRATYSNFWLYGNHSSVRSPVAGIKIDGNCIANHFRDLFISEITGQFVLLDGALGRVPALTIFDNIYGNHSDTHGWEIRAGINLTFRACVSEVTAGRAWNINSASRPVNTCLLDGCWNEQTGSNAHPQTAVYLEGCDHVTLVRHITNGYGSSPPTTGDGIHLNNCVACVIDAPSVSGGHGSTPGSVKIRITNGRRNVLHNLGAEISAVDMAITGATDTIVTANNAEIASNDLIFVTNATASIPAGATAYISPGSGFVSSNESLAAQFIYGAMSIAGLHVAAGSSPGSDSFVYTVFKNGAPTAITSRVSDAWASGAHINADVAFKMGDRLSVAVHAGAGSGGLAAGAAKATLAIRR